MVYLDLKPEHIIVCESQIKLIDFNVATFLSKEGNIYNLFGNKDFTAPELFDGAAPNPLCDIYSIGKIMHFMSQYVDTALLPKIYQIIKKAAHADPACRYETVDKLRSELLAQQLCNQQPHLRTKIAVLGSHPGCGVTHFSISLVSALNFMGYSACYYEKNSTNHLRQMQNTEVRIQEQNGLLSYGFFRGYPNYGDGILLPTQDWDIQVYDYGSMPPVEIPDADVILYLCDDSLWHMQDSLVVGEDLWNRYHNLSIICNMGHTKTMHILAKHFHSSVFRYPYYPNPFSADRFMVSFASKLLQRKRRKRPFFSFGNRPSLKK